MNEEEYRELQNSLVKTPNAGNVIQGGGGIRKIRWKLQGRGKRGGARVIYYWETNENQIFMLYAYAKNERENLTKDQLSMLKKVVDTEFKHEE